MKYLINLCSTWVSQLVALYLDDIAINDKFFNVSCKQKKMKVGCYKLIINKIIKVCCYFLYLTIYISIQYLNVFETLIAVPISVFLFTLPLPYLGVASSLPPGFIGGALVLVMGMLIYAWTPSTRAPIPSPFTTSWSLQSL